MLSPTYSCVFVLSFFHSFVAFHFISLHFVSFRFQFNFVSVSFQCIISFLFSCIQLHFSVIWMSFQFQPIWFHFISFHFHFHFISFHFTQSFIALLHSSHFICDIDDMKWFLSIRAYFPVANSCQFLSMKLLPCLVRVLLLPEELKHEKNSNYI